MKKKKLWIGILLACFMGMYLYIQNYDLQVTSYSIIKQNLPKEFDCFKIVQISDYHNETSKGLNKKLLKYVKEENPNIIVITGDLIDSRRTNIKQSIEMTSSLVKIAPIYYVNGNHESRISNYDELVQKLENIGVIVLENDTIELIKDGSKINLIGVEDVRMDYTKQSDSTILKDNLEKSSYDSNYFSILLSHHPELFNEYVNHKLDLVLCGHAHGGQIRLPFIGGLIAPDQGLFPKYTSGMFKENQTTMVVSRGVGNSLFPFRVGNKPEVVVVSLRVN